MDAEFYISRQPSERQNVLSNIHGIIIENDANIEVKVEPMMGKEMIIYKEKGGLMKYALSSVKNYISLHVLPIYGSKELHEKYKAKLIGASFQKGCINFIDETEMPLPVVKELISDCAKINLAKIRENYLKAKKKKSER
ncbi:hypothetical protein [Emticicia sp. BO119]|uniref:hypothetical protein n=1 Tax=Emticicia sp. BO119 TaxID=2757768 RepID=UPI0015F0CDBD|nr:hypothetical protein [Emticicia sp. BO119]MBA4849315.1 hypothetical protein [Emticicia sp. BO119]